MFRKTFIVGLIFLPLSLIAESDVRKKINLNEPGALEKVKQENPLHYRKISEILNEVTSKSETKVPDWIQTTFNGKDVRYGPMLLTSAPPKRDLAFTLDDSRYEVVLTLSNIKAEIVPLKR